MEEGKLDGKLEHSFVFDERQNGKEDEQARVK